MDTRPDDVVSPITDGVLPCKSTPEEARAAGRVPYVKPTPDKSVMLLIDHQIGLLSSVRDFSSLAALRANVLGLGRIAKALRIPVLLSSSNAHWQNGDTIPELKDLFPDEPIHRRTGIINCYEDPSFRAAFDELTTRTGRSQVIIAGVTIGTCAAMPTLAMLNDGYQVFPVIDACGAWNHYEAEAATARMVRAGAEPVTTFALGCELQADWKLPTSNDMLDPFLKDLPEYGYVIQGFWNNANGHTVPDPFGQVT
ncbi:isochorismatase family protein [Actinocorallia sp. A-T 12471]|uniref:isochorismatase family protein n=1 Tax=Actinocorallia sp. A-T 12471 TaxID=3089813 RepID=UPI0029CEE236|nr:isochorismatase family protein [Actinocorallia sp. A-T 12471]MDX6740787.1 isochorismatase family protein [Actinocorallia sp. A-T 12471]